MPPAASRRGATAPQIMFRNSTEHVVSEMANFAAVEQRVAAERKKSEKMMTLRDRLKASCCSRKKDQEYGRINARYSRSLLCAGDVSQFWSEKIWVLVQFGQLLSVFITFGTGRWNLPSQSVVVGGTHPSISGMTPVGSPITRVGWPSSHWTFLPPSMTSAII